MAYAKRKGEEFYSDGIGFKNKNNAQKCLGEIKERVKAAYPRFSVKGFIKQDKKGNWQVFSNNTVRNLNEHERQLKKKVAVNTRK